MRYEFTITLTPDEERNETLLAVRITEALAKAGAGTAADGVAGNRAVKPTLLKRSIDARHGRVLVHLRYGVSTGSAETENASSSRARRTADPAKRVVIVGSGPAGLFAALRLLEAGVTPVVVERGKPTDERKRDIALISREGKVDPESNYCFGEGGAGTFSDGKLHTKSKKRGDEARVRAIFREFGADEAILTDAHPHVGTDRLPGIVNAMRAEIERHGGEVRFGTRCVGVIADRAGSGETTARGVTVVSCDGTAGSAEGPETEILGDAVILATGHSARDAHEMIAKLEALTGIPALEAKTFAMGVRVEHPRGIVDRIQYHGRAAEANLGAATYKLASQEEGRGVYSFCMCPGGLVVPSASEGDAVVVNGMSPSSRATKWSNAAIVVEIRPEDVPDSFRSDGHPALAGVRFQRWLEREAFRQAALALALAGANGQAAPAQRLADFLARRPSATLPESSYTAGLVSSRLDEWLPAHIETRLRAAFPAFDRLMRGFACDEALLIAPETRTSSPVRVLRDVTTLECAGVRGLYPAGEGSGYSGGISSSAMDGERVAEAILAARGWE